MQSTAAIRRPSSSILAITYSLLLTSRLSAETTWTYDFGNAVKSFANASSQSTSFLPEPSVGGGTARVRIGSAGGAFVLDDTNAGSQLVGTASRNTSINKFSIYDYDGRNAFTIRMTISFSGASSGVWCLVLGNGGRFSDNNLLSADEVFAALRWDFRANGALDASRYTASSSWAVTNLPTFTQNTTYSLALYGNNSLAPLTYDGHELAANQWDLWLNDVKAGSGIAKAGLANATTIDSFMFYGMNSTDNLATMTLDSITYANYLVPEPSAWHGGLTGMAAWLLVTCRRLRHRSPKNRQANGLRPLPSDC